jgi:hypothetical protein
MMYRFSIYFPGIIFQNQVSLFPPPSPSFLPSITNFMVFVNCNFFRKIQQQGDGYNSCFTTWEGIGWFRDFRLVGDLIICW